MLSARIKLLFGIITTSLLLTMPVQAQVAQYPLLSQSTSVEPNLVFVFDPLRFDSASYMYEFGSDPAVWVSQTRHTWSRQVAGRQYDVLRPASSVRVTGQCGSNLQGCWIITHVYNLQCLFLQPWRHQHKARPERHCVQQLRYQIPNTDECYVFQTTSGSVEATGTATVSGGKITGITVTNKGSGYTKTATITLSKTSGKSCKPKVIMENDRSPSSVNQKWNGTGSVASLSDFFNPSYTPDAGSPLAARRDRGGLSESG